MAMVCRGELRRQPVEKAAAIVGKDLIKSEVGTWNLLYIAFKVLLHLF